MDPSTTTPPAVPGAAPLDTPQSDAQAVAAAEAREATRREEEDRYPHRMEVRGPAAGRHRAGRHFTVVPTLIEPGTLTRADFEAITSDPHLSVRLSEHD